MGPAQRPIGIFDSGVGGLAALRALQALLPNERFLYVADLAHLPYGDLGAAQIRARTEAVIGHLRERGVKAIVAACNTVCAAAPQALAERDGVPVFDVIDAGISALAALPDVRRVGLLATRATVRERSTSGGCARAGPTSRCSRSSARASFR